MPEIEDVEIAVIGAGVVGIATAYYLCKKHRRSSVLLIDSRAPMSYTSAQSGDNYRNWWPSRVMTRFTNHSIRLMQAIARDSGNVLQMRQRGYALATRKSGIDALLDNLKSNYRDCPEPVRIHCGSSATAYQSSLIDDWESTLDGVDVLSNKALIRRTFPAFSSEIEHVLHIRRAGDISSQQMAQYMLQQAKPLGCKQLRAQVVGLTRDRNYTLQLTTQGGKLRLNAERVVNAAGPYVAEIAALLGVELPVQTIFQQKIAFRDHLHAVPRQQPFSIDIDDVQLQWRDQEKSALLADPQLAWLTGPISGGVHCRPEGNGDWVKLGWAYNRSASQPDNRRSLREDPCFDEGFPEIVLRGASRLNRALRPYIEHQPAGRLHYGGYYTMTQENWPLIGPLDNNGAFVAGALSGFGSMAACAAGSLCADWVCDGERPDYADALSPARYNDAQLLQQISSATETGVL